MIVWIWMIISDTTLLAYVNGDHEYALFNPYGTDMHEWKISPTYRVLGLEGIWPRNGFDLRGAVVVDSAVGPRNGFHQAMRPKKITMVLELRFPCEGTQIENIMSHEVDIRRKELLPIYEQFISIKSCWNDRFFKATSGGNAAADPFDASAGGADDDDFYN
ncbi:hypothetical protein Tco_0862012 [Tanacetum coccineum]